MSTTQTKENKQRYKNYTIAESYKTYKYKKRSTDELKREVSGGNHYIKIEDIQHNSPLALTYYEYVKIVKLFFKELYSAILEGSKVKLPHVGEIWIGRYKVGNSKYKPVDWVATKKFRATLDDPTGQFVYHENYHTNDWFGKLMWKRPRSKVEYRPFKLCFVRNRKREFSKLLTTDPSAIYKYEIL